MRDYIELFFLFLCLLASLTAFFQGPSPLYLRVFPFYFFIALVVQVIGFYLSRHSLSNINLYSIYSTLEFSLYFFILREIIRNRKIKLIILIVIIVYATATLLHLFFFKKGQTFHSAPYAIGCSLVVVLCIVYFIELFQLPKAPSLKNEPSFWICTTFLFSYVCSFPFWGLLNFIKTAPRIILGNLMNIALIINILTYCLFIIAFLCRIKIRRSTL